MASHTWLSRRLHVDLAYACSAVCRPLQMVGTVAPGGVVYRGTTTGGLRISNG